MNALVEWTASADGGMARGGLVGDEADVPVAQQACGAPCARAEQEGADGVPTGDGALRSGKVHAEQSARAATDAAVVIRFAGRYEGFGNHGGVR